LENPSRRRRLALNFSANEEEVEEEKEEEEEEEEVVVEGGGGGRDHHASIRQEGLRYRGKKGRRIFV